MTRWLDPPPVSVPPSFAELDLPPLLARTLIRRGLTDVTSARAFLDPDHLPSTPFPDLVFPPQRGIEWAVERIRTAIRRGERIGVWGDFDVDGQTATAVLVHTLRALNAHVTYYIPIRGKEGHGLHLESLQSLLKRDIRLLLTCDTGITAFEAIDYARARGVDVIVTDHHDLSDHLPNAQAILNPKLLPPDHPLAHLAGVGVACKLAERLLDEEQTSLDPADLLDLAALGLVADVAILRGETRALVQRGLHTLRRSRRPGLIAMAELAGTPLETATEETIGFTFAPRLNALGRLSDANPAVELLLTRDPTRARVLATQVEGLNVQRRLLTSQVLQAIEHHLREHPEELTEPALILAHPHWPTGVLGLVANKLVERYNKPVVLLTESDGILRGSARSIEGVHITQAIATQQSLLLNFGGHPMAAGLSLTAENYPTFRPGLLRAIQTQLGARAHEEPTLEIDAWLGLEEITLDLAEQLERLAPFGAGNPELVLATRNVTLRSATEIGPTREHLRLTIEDQNGQTQSLLWWGGAGENLPEPGQHLDIAYSLRATSYRGQRQITLHFRAWRSIEPTPLTLRRLAPTLHDWRSRPSWSDLPPDALVWAEGSDSSRGVSRLALHPAEHFVIYTTPPSPAELRAALKTVQPQVVYVIARSPADHTPETFLTRLAGLCKYALNRRSGVTSLSKLAAAMAARPVAVEIGLHWLAAGGHLNITTQNDQVTLSPQKPEKDPYLQAELFVALRSVLMETAAYRNYFTHTPELQALFTDET